MARKSFKDNPAMRFISPPETHLDNHESGLAARPPEGEPSPPFRAGHKGHENTRINLAFSPDDFQYLQAIARQDGLSITEYLNRLISADRKTRVDELKRA
ncbi:MAG: hypothetical protein ABRQ24_08280 [Syntrophomonadaceae bacterium]